MRPPKRSTRSSTSSYTTSNSSISDKSAADLSTSIPTSPSNTEDKHASAAQLGRADLADRTSLSPPHCPSAQHPSLDIKILQPLTELSGSNLDKLNQNVATSGGVHVFSTPTSQLSRRRTRTKTTASQILALENLYEKEKHPTMQARQSLAQQIGLELKFISVWFMNKRQSARKSSCVDVTRQQDASPARLCDSGLPCKNGNATSPSQLGHGPAKHETYPASEDRHSVKDVDELAVQPEKIVKPILSDILYQSPSKEANTSPSATPATPLSCSPDNISGPISLNAGSKRKGSLQWACEQEYSRARKRARQRQLVFDESASFHSRSGLGCDDDETEDEGDARPLQNSESGTLSVRASLSCSNLSVPADIRATYPQDVIEVALSLIAMSGRGAPIA